MNEKKKTSQLSILMPTELVTRLKSDAEKEYRSLSAEISYICDRYLTEKEKNESAK